MPQAKRIKDKPKAKPKSTSQRRWNLPWGLLLVILVSGGILAYYLYGAYSGQEGVGQGLRVLMENSKPSPKQEDQAIKSLIDDKSAPKEFEFYSILPNIEQIMPDDLPEAQPSRAPDNLDYYLQAASFRSHADAEKLKAHLALKGFASVTQRRATEDNGVFYRVRLGPYRDKRKAKTAKNKLQKLGVRPFIFTVKKTTG